MLFGGTLFVWGYNRTADLHAILMGSLLLPILHYVDDFGCIEPEGLADSGFSSFSKVSTRLGWCAEPDKHQRPAEKHIIQGHYLSVGPEIDYATIEATERR